MTHFPVNATREPMKQKQKSSFTLVITADLCIYLGAESFRGHRGLVSRTWITNPSLHSYIIY